MIKVALVDDQPLIIQGLKMIVEDYKDFTVVWTASNGEEAVTLASQVTPDLILMDIRMPLMNGVEATGKIKALNPQTKIVMLTTFEEEEYLMGALKKGASGYMLKDASPEEIIASLLNAYKGGLTIAPKVTPAIQQQLIKPESKVSHAFETLTTREYDVAVFISEGLSNKEIAEAMFLSEGTVKNHLTHILEKLGCRDRTQLAIYVLKNLS